MASKKRTGRTHNGRPRHTDEEVVAAVLTARGNRGAAAKALGLSPSQVSRRIRSPGCQKLLGEVVADVLERAKQGWVSLVDDSFNALREVLRQDNDRSSKTRAAIHVLERIGEIPIVGGAAMGQDDSLEARIEAAVVAKRERIEAEQGDDAP